MSAGAVEPGLAAAVAQFERSSGHRVVVRFGTGPQLSARLEANEVAGVLIAPVGVMDAAVAARKVDTRTRVTVGRVGVGVVIRQDSDLPDVTSPDALRRALIAAPAVVFNRASTGQYIEKLIGELGIADLVQTKAVRVDTGEAVMERIAGGRGQEIGFGAMTEIRMLERIGVRLAGPLPATLQNFTAYDAALLVAASAASPAAAFVRFLTEPEGQSYLAAAGIVPPR